LQLHTCFTAWTDLFDALGYFAGIFFMYDLSPIRVTVTKEFTPLLAFLTRMCAVIGGIFTVSGFTDALVNRVVKATRPRGISRRGGEL
jgi:hypothetical protein